MMCHLPSLTLPIKIANAIFILLLFSLAGCASLSPPHDIVTELRWDVPKESPTKQERRKLAVVLSSGALRGYAHIGVMRAFENAGIQPDIIVGTSAGAIVGSLWASGMQSKAVEAVSGELGMNVFFDWSSAIRGIARGSFKGLVSGIEIENFVIRHVAVKNLEGLPTRFAVVTADLNSGEPIPVNGGSIAKAVRASAGVPVAMAPVEVVIRGQKRELVDGGLVEPIPVKTARQMGADIVVVVDVGYRPSEANIWNPLDVSFQSLQIAINALRSEQLLNADLVITPRIREQDVSRENANKLISEGERAASEVMGVLFAKLKTR